MALLSGIVPYTRTVMFEPSMGLTVKSQGSMLATDIAIALCVGLGAQFVGIAALALPYITLSRSYAKSGRSQVATRVILYRSWLFPAASLAAALSYWLLPVQAQIVPELISIVPIVFMFWSMVSAARVASGIGPLMSIAVSAVPLFVLQAVALLAATALRPFFSTNG